MTEQWGHTGVMDNFDVNVATLAGWVQEASGGLLTAEPSSFDRGNNLVIKRVDGAPLAETEDAFGGGPTTGYIVSVWVPKYAKLTRRNRKDMRAIHDAVRAVWYRYLRETSGYVITSALSNFERRNRLDKVTA